MKPDVLKLDWLITGVGHSGTGYVARMFTDGGLVCGHEHLFHKDIGFKMNPEIGPWGFEWSKVRAESGWPAAYHLEHPILEKVTIIHLIRNPLKVIESVMCTGALLNDAVARYCEINRMIARAKQKVLKRRVEDREILLDTVGLEKSDFDDKTYNTHRNKKNVILKWTDILNAPGGEFVYDQAKEFSYFEEGD